MKAVSRYVFNRFGIGLISPASKTVIIKIFFENLKPIKFFEEEIILLLTQAYQNISNVFNVNLAGNRNFEQEQKHWLQCTLSEFICKQTL